MHEPFDEVTRSPGDDGPTGSRAPGVAGHPGLPPGAARDDGVPADGVSVPGGSITVVGDTLLLTGDVGTDLCLAFRATDRRLDGVTCLDARGVTFLGSPGLTLLAEVARVRGAGVLMWASRAALRPLTLSGLDHLFDVRRVD